MESTTQFFAVTDPRVVLQSTSDWETFERWLSRFDKRQRQRVHAFTGNRTIRDRQRGKATCTEHLFRDKTPQKRHHLSDALQGFRDVCEQDVETYDCATPSKSVDTVPTTVSLAARLLQIEQDSKRCSDSVHLATLGIRIRHLLTWDAWEQHVKECNSARKDLSTGKQETASQAARRIYSEKCRQSAGPVEKSAKCGERLYIMVHRFGLGILPMMGNSTLQLYNQRLNLSDIEHLSSIVSDVVPQFASRLHRMQRCMTKLVLRTTRDLGWDLRDLGSGPFGGFLAEAHGDFLIEVFRTPAILELAVQTHDQETPLPASNSGEDGDWEKVHDSGPQNAARTQEVMAESVDWDHIVKDWRQGGNWDGTLDHM